MAASTNRDVTLTVQAETIGENSIREMADQIRALAKTSGDAGPQFNALAQQLDRVADSQAAIQTLQELDAAMSTTAARVQDAAAAYDAASAKAQEQQVALQALKDAQTAANAVWQEAKLAQIGAAEAYALTRAEIQAHSERTDADRQALSQAAAAQATATAELRRARAAYQELGPDVKAASDQFNALQRSANFANSELAKAQSVAANQASAYEAATAAARELGVETDLLVAEQARLLDTQNEIVVGAQRIQAAQSAQAESERLLAQSAVALQQASIALERELQAEQQASLRAAAAAEQDALAKAEAADGYQLYLRAIEEVNAALHDQAQAKAAADALAAAAAAREAAEATLAEADAYDAFLEATRELDAVLANEQAAQLALAEAKAEQAESDRLAIIQINASFEARRQGVLALQAELAAINEVAAADAVLAEQQAASAAALERTAAAARAAGTALNDAFSGVGVRSLAEIQAEVAGVEQSMVVLRANFEAGAISSQDMARAIGAATVQLEALHAEAANIPQVDGVFKTLSGTINGIISDFGALGAAVATIGFAVKPILDANIQLETTRRTLTQVLGSVDAANAEIDKLATAANRTGVAVGGLNTSFSTFAAAAKTAGLNTAQIEQIFNSTVGAAGTLGLSGEKVTLILEALGQMASKGVVSMEELRRQLGNSLPGALALMAQSLGITTAQLDKLVSSGQLLASDALPALATAMAKIGDQTKPVEGLQQSFARLGNAVTETYQKFSNTAVYAGLNAAISSLAKNFQSVLTVVTSLGELWAAKAILGYLDNITRLNASTAALTTTTTAATVATAANTAAEETSSTAIAANSAARVANAEATVAQTTAQEAQNASIGTSGGLFKANATVLQQAASVAAGGFNLLRSGVSSVFGLLGGIPGIALLVGTNAKAIGTAIGETAASWTRWGDELRKNEAALDAQTAKEKANFEASQTLGVSIVKLTAQYNDLTAPLQKAIIAAEKHAEAQKLEGDATREIASLNGQQTVIVEAAAKATNLQAQASQAVADKMNAQVAATANLVAQIESQVASGVKLNDAEQKKLTTLQQTLVVQQAAADKAQAQADADNVAATAAFNHAVALKDQSGSLVDLQAALAEATNRVTALETAQALGVDVSKQLTKATSDQAQAQALVTKAYQDTVDNANRAAASVKNGASVTTAATNANIAFLNSEKQQALAIGDTYRARTIDVEIQREQITVIEQQVSVKNAEIAADKAQLAVLQAKISPADANYRQELADIEALKAKIQVEQSESDALRSNISGLETQTDALERNTNATNSNAAAKAAAAKEAYVDPIASKGPTAVDNTGYSALLAKINAGTLTKDDAGALQAVIAQLRQNQQENVIGNQLNPGLVSQDAINSVNAELKALQDAYDRLAGPTLNLGGNGKGSGAFGGSGTAPSTTDSTTTAPTTTPSSTSHTVTINLNGQQTTINAASADDATALATLMQQLAAAATRAQ